VKSSFVLPLTPSTSDPFANENRSMAKEYNDVGAQLLFSYCGKIIEVRKKYTMDT